MGNGLKIGLSWRGGVRQTDQASRSIALEMLLPLLRIAGCNFVSLQYGEQEKEVADMRSGHGVTLESWPDALLSYDETAALTSAMDLVLSVDTSIAHLAGAMGVPTWAMLPANAEWRYRISGANMPWYPGMRIFRRQRGTDWVPAIEEVAKELRALLRAKELSS